MLYELTYINYFDSVANTWQQDRWADWGQAVSHPLDSAVESWKQGRRSEIDSVNISHYESNDLTKAHKPCYEYSNVNYNTIFLQKIP